MLFPPDVQHFTHRDNFLDPRLEINSSGYFRKIEQMKTVVTILECVYGRRGAHGWSPEPQVWVDPGPVTQAHSGALAPPRPPAPPACEAEHLAP